MTEPMTIVDYRYALDEGPGPAPCPGIEDRDYWQALRARTPDCLVERLTAQAAEAAGHAPSALPASGYLTFFREGTRAEYEQLVGLHNQRLSAAVLAECLTGEGEYLDAAQDYLWATCEQSSWCLPAHEQDLPNVDAPVADLFASLTALDVAEADYLLGDRLHPAVRRRVRREVRRRVFVPYFDPHWPHWLFRCAGQTTFNWTAVCNAGIVGASLYLVDDPHERAEFVNRALLSLPAYLAGFCDDGGTSEGVGYWNFGFGCYVLLADLVDRATSGRAGWLSDPRMDAIARFPLATALGADHWATFADCPYDKTPERWILALLAHRLGRDELAQLARSLPIGEEPLRPGGTLRHRLRELVFAPEPRPDVAVPLSGVDWLEDLQWLIARGNPADPSGLTLAVKAGHNGEMHNQDDVGSFIVQWRGARLITDPGAGRYTRDYFRGPEQPISKSSATHSVPVINGLSQAGGKTAAASDVRYLHDEHGDGLSMQLAGVYPPEARLRSLLRTVRLDRSADPGAVELTDTFAFDDQPGTCESVLISLHEPKQETPGRVILTDPGADAALAVTFDPGRVEARIDSLGEIPYSRGTWRLWRIVLTTPNPSRQGEIKARIEPQTA